MCPEVCAVPFYYTRYRLLYQSNSLFLNRFLPSCPHDVGRIVFQKSLILKDFHYEFARNRDWLTIRNAKERTCAKVTETQLFSFRGNSILEKNIAMQSEESNPAPYKQRRSRAKIHISIDGKNTGGSI